MESDFILWTFIISAILLCAAGACFIFCPGHPSGRKCAGQGEETEGVTALVEIREAAQQNDAAPEPENLDGIQPCQSSFGMLSAEKDGKTDIEEFSGGSLGGDRLHEVLSNLILSGMEVEDGEGNRLTADQATGMAGASESVVPDNMPEAPRTDPGPEEPRDSRVAEAIRRLETNLSDIKRQSI